MSSVANETQGGKAEGMNKSEGEILDKGASEMTNTTMSTSSASTSTTTYTAFSSTTPSKHTKTTSTMKEGSRRIIKAKAPPPSPKFVITPADEATVAENQNQKSRNRVAHFRPRNREELLTSTTPTKHSQQQEELDRRRHHHEARSDLIQKRRTRTSDQNNNDTTVNSTAASSATTSTPSSSDKTVSFTSPPAQPVSLSDGPSINPFWNILQSRKRPTRESFEWSHFDDVKKQKTMKDDDGGEKFRDINMEIKQNDENNDNDPWWKSNSALIVALGFVAMGFFNRARAW